MPCSHRRHARHRQNLTKPAQLRASWMSPACSPDAVRLAGVHSLVAMRSMFHATHVAALACFCALQALKVMQRFCVACSRYARSSRIGNHMWRRGREATESGRGCVSCARGVQIFDTDGSGELGYREFVLGVWSLLSLDKGDLPGFTFWLYDHDYNGHLGAYSHRVIGLVVAAVQAACSHPTCRTSIRNKRAHEHPQRCAWAGNCEPEWVFQQDSPLRACVATLREVQQEEALQRATRQR